MVGVMKKYLYISLLTISFSLATREPMVMYPGEVKNAFLTRKVDVDFTSSINTQDPDQVEFDIGEEIPSYNKPMISTGTLR